MSFRRRAFGNPKEFGLCQFTPFNARTMSFRGRHSCSIVSRLPQNTMTRENGDSTMWSRRRVRRVTRGLYYDSLAKITKGGRSNRAKDVSEAAKASSGALGACELGARAAGMRDWQGRKGAKTGRDLAKLVGWKWLILDFVCHIVSLSINPSSLDTLSRTTTPFPSSLLCFSSSTVSYKTNPLNQRRVFPSSSGVQQTRHLAGGENLM